jgi:hypothetical protein
MNAQQIILMLLAYPSSLPPSVQPITIYNRIPLIQHSQDWRGVGLSNILDCQTVPTFCNQHSENVHLSVSYFHFIIKRHNFFNYHTPSHSFSFKMHCCKPCMQHIVQMHWFRWFPCLLLEKTLHTPDYINHHHLSFCYLIS